MQLSLKCIFMWISLTSLVQQGAFNLNRNRKGLNEILRIWMLYVLVLRDCSSIGQSTALSRRKLRVRAPSVPTYPNTIKKKHQYVFPFSVKLGTKGRVSFPMGMVSFFFVFVSHFSRIGIKGACVNCYNYNYW